MLGSVLTALESANYRSAARKGTLSCPACLSRPTAVPLAVDDVIICPHCGTAASGYEWAHSKTAATLVGDADSPAQGTRIARMVGSDGATTWNIPASGKSGGLMFFAVIWCAFTGIFTVATVAAGTKSNENVVPTLYFTIFLSVFWAAGLGMLYAACRNKYAKHRLKLQGDRISLRRELFGRVTERHLATATIQSIAAVKFYSRNYQPVHGIEIRAPQGKLRFGSMLTEEEKAWLVADLRRTVRGSASAAAATPTTHTRRETFTISLPVTSRALGGAGFLLAAVGTGGFLFGAYGMESWIGGFSLVASKDFFTTFRVLWLFGSAVNAAIGFALLYRYLATRHHVHTLEGTASEVAICTRKFGRVVEQQVFPREDVLDVRTMVSGNSNGKPMKRVELITRNKAILLGRWMNGEKSEAIVEELRSAL